MKQTPRKTGFEHVREFHERFSHPVHHAPVVPDDRIIRLRISLILEELHELAEACVPEQGAGAVFLERLAQAQQALAEVKQFDVDLVAVADALTDINYVTYGAGHCFGINLDETMMEVQRSNMSKLGADGQPVVDERGKILKGPDYQPPDLKTVLGL